MKRLSFLVVFLLAATLVRGQSVGRVAYGNGVPGIQTPDCAQTMVYINSLTGDLYTSVGTPCAWALKAPVVPTITTQTQPTRVLGTVYRNTTSKPIFVTVVASFTATPTNIFAYTDSSATPTTAVTAFNGVNGEYPCIFFVVLPGNYYYAATTTGTSALFLWTEWN